ncbi:hypothetical protein ACFW9F_02010 [Streptomyces sp. NPDC059506]|uniref:hypothetical protein n=1 Tax=unclassified Streptomyces TaxID=2593676 RepID=UPI000CC123F2|nr:hypothetical protein [Streptomyces sp. SCUT-3]PLW66355.1 hypothetical protein C0036_23205 [Streptomyces sp. DJ]QMV20989.1 hypothetical protein GQS52_03425 [Streptomyces sp. SCUT-3]
MPQKTPDREPVLQELHASLGRRRRPEDVARLVLQLLDEGPGGGPPLDGRTRRALEKAARGSLQNLWHGYTSMLEDFTRPVGAQRQLARAAELFPSLPELPDSAGDDPEQIEAAIRTAGQEIAKRFGASDFLSDRLNRAQRKEVGLGEMSKRQYNKRFRLLRRMEADLAQLLTEQRKLEVTVIGKSGLASRLLYEEFAADPGTAAFVAYLTARANLRSEFTVSGQQRPYDEVAHALFRRLRNDPARTNWYAVAHVHPTTEVLDRLTDGQRGRLLAFWYRFLLDVAELLETAWKRQPLDRSTMIVRRGDDSTSWNQAARAWTKARANWFALLHAMGAEEVAERLCPGKVLLLVAADVAAWHRQTGGGLHPDTGVWADLPLPWQVLRGETGCPRSLVEEVCQRHGVDPVAGGWTEPRKAVRPAPFRPTPELVHGVEVGDPLLASVLRSAGFFSGRPPRPAAQELAPDRGA